jgi:phage portal protein BeeE
LSLFGSIAREFKGRDGHTWGEISTLGGGLFGSYQSRSGVAVGWRSALRCSTFLACTRRIAEAVSTVPTKVYKKPRGGKREEAFDDPLLRASRFRAQRMAGHAAVSRRRAG